MSDRSRRVPHLIVGALAASSILAVGTINSPSVSAAATIIDADGLPGHVGVDYGTGQYASVYRWNAGGQLDSVCMGGQQCNAGGANARYEFYPHNGFDPQGNPNFDPWVGDVGSVHIESTGGNVFNLGPVTLPRVGVNFGGFVGQRLDGDIVSSTPVGAGRVSVNAFQIETVHPDPERPIPGNGTVSFGSFASTQNNGTRWTAGVGWPGRYILFVIDNVTGRSIQAFQDLGYGANPAIDLDAICFGFDNCAYLGGAPGTTSGTFHPTPPTRILDTRFGVGITNGAIRSGGGFIKAESPEIRRDWTANHELKVTGVGGVPESGVSAVLLNVTAVVPPGPGYVALTPKAPACCGGLAIFDDQASLPAGEPSTSNLNVAGGDIVPNLVLARVGAGGKVRIYNWEGPTEMVADIAGWFDTGGTNANGSGFAGVTPTRLFDSRNNIGTTRGPFAVGETRTVKVTGVAGVPTTATSVVVNITATRAQGSGFATAFPTGVTLPVASNLNYVAGTTRANLAVVKVGTGGNISLNAAETSVDLIVDVMGSFGPNGGQVEAIDPVRLIDTRNSTGPMVVDAPQVIQVRGQAGVPADATAVILNVTAANPHGFGYFTVWPTGVAEPTTSNVNFVGGQNVPNMVMVKLGTGGTITVKDSVNRADLIIDVFGYVR